MMKATIELKKKSAILEKLIESDDVLKLIEDTISQIGGSRNRFEIFCESHRGNDEDYVIYRDFKKVGILRLVIA